MLVAAASLAGDTDQQSPDLSHLEEVTSATPARVLGTVQWSYSDFYYSY